MTSSSNALPALLMSLLFLMVLGIVVGTSIFDRTQHDVSMSTPLPSTATTTTTTLAADCLCIFDIDRTLTGKQEEMERCPDNQIQAGVPDSAFGVGGQLTLSQLTQALEKTFCSKCYLGSISQGSATDDIERQILFEHLDEDHKEYPLPANQDAWGGSCGDTSKPLITLCPDGEKQTAVPNIIQYYRDAKGVNITDEQVFFFDDSQRNIDSFRETKYNAKQISCKTRDDAIEGIGLCGATVDEITRFSGFSLCDAADEPLSV